MLSELLKCVMKKKLTLILGAKPGADPPRCKVLGEGLYFTP